MFFKGRGNEEGDDEESDGRLSFAGEDEDDDDDLSFDGEATSSNQISNNNNNNNNNNTSNSTIKTNNRTNARRPSMTSSKANRARPNASPISGVGLSNDTSYVDVAKLRMKHKKVPLSSSRADLSTHSDAETVNSRPAASTATSANNSLNKTIETPAYNNPNYIAELRSRQPKKGSSSRISISYLSNASKKLPDNEKSSLYATAETAEEIYGEGTNLGSQRNNRERSSAESSHQSFRSRTGYGNASANLENTSSISDMAHNAEVVKREEQELKCKNYKKGENLLINISHLGEPDDVEDTLRKPTAAKVNKHGYPQKGRKKAEGPFEYVLATVQKIHFDQDSRYYTVERADTGASIKVEAVSMEPIKAGCDAEKAAMEAAQQKENNSDNKNNGTIFIHNTWVKSCCSSCGKIFKWMKDAFNDQAAKILRGSSPYRCEISITTVNILVLCSLIVAFLDQAKYAFLTKDTDYALGVVLFVAWVVLILELLFQISIRPDNYKELLQNEQACNPSTVRYINQFHLVFEAIALILAMPDFLPIFGVNPPIGSAKASIYAAIGKSKLRYIGGHLYIFSTRLRLFCLVRHKFNNWINAIYFNKKDAVRTSLLLDPDQLHKTEDGGPDHQSKKLMRSKSANLSARNDEDDLLLKAAKIGTALLLVNSHRAMVLLLIITLVVPFIATAALGGPNLTFFQMTNYLHEINTWTNKYDKDCNHFYNSVDGWLNASQAALNAQHVSSVESQMVVWAQLLPNKCNDRFPSGVIKPKPDVCDDEANDEICRRWHSATTEELEEALNIRKGNLIKMTLGEEGGITTTVVWNLSHTVSLSCFNSFMLQLLMLVLVVVSLGLLRSDANRLVITPLRRMLRIVLKYASNPLAATPKKTAQTLSQKSIGSNDETGNNVDDFAPFELDFDFSGKDKLGSYETEQLITAVTKITDLLRKCWGVAGAGIISSNLARNIKGDTVVFQPTVPGKLVYALFTFAGINDFGHLLRSLDKDVMTLINDIAIVIHNEIYRWSHEESGQCNKNLGAAFLMVHRIGDSDEVRQKNDEAKKVIFSKSSLQASVTSTSSARTTTDHEHTHLPSLPGINEYADRALLGILKAFAGINRAKNVKAWEKDYRVGGGVGAFSVGMSFGMDAGWAVEGAVGSRYKIDATYLSSHVNMAARMMSACKQYKLAILLSQAVEELLSKECRSKLRHVDTVYVKGSISEQRIYTYDARHKGVNFFLNMRPNEIADKEAEKSSTQFWDKDQDLKEMRGHISTKFLETYNYGLNRYLDGYWKEAAEKLKEANESMIADVVQSGRIDIVTSVKSKLMDSSTTDEDAKSTREEFGDGPCHALVSYMENRNCIKPEGWKGVRELTSK